MPAPLQEDKDSFRAVPALALLAAINTVYFFSYFQRVGIPGTIFDRLQTEFHASASGIAMLGALFLYIYGFMQLPAGMLTDRFGAIRVFTAGGLVLNLGAFLFPLAPNLVYLYAARALVGLGASLIFASIVKALVSIFPQRLFAILLGISLSVGYSGGLAGTLPFEWGASRWGWRAFLLGVAGAGSLALVIAFVLHARIRTMRSAGDVKLPEKKTSLKAVFLNPRIRPLILVHATNFSMYFFLQAVMGKKILQDCFGMPSTEASFFTFVMMFTTIVCLALSGIVSRAIGNRRAPVLRLATLMMLIGAGLLLLGVVFGFPARVILLGYCLLATSSLGSPIGNTMMKELNPPDVVGASVGICNTSCYLSVALFTSFSGWLLDRFKEGALVTKDAIIYPRAAYLTIVSICFAFMAISFAVSFFLPETQGRHPESEA